LENIPSRSARAANRARLGPSDSYSRHHGGSDSALTKVSESTEKSTSQLSVDFRGFADRMCLLNGALECVLFLLPGAPRQNIFAFKFGPKSKRMDSSASYIKRFLPGPRFAANLETLLSETCS
jgi:hypothetical protein